jgi:hypothetical protein
MARWDRLLLPAPIGRDDYACIDYSVAFRLGSPARANPALVAGGARHQARIYKRGEQYETMGAFHGHKTKNNLFGQVGQLGQVARKYST